ncbi:MAG: hypothetical protein JWP91_2098 [Fibrobacteres bacterium]|nr:hypothetical protein [Fibrobacterota bacterium]
MDLKTIAGVGFIFAGSILPSLGQGVGLSGTVTAKANGQKLKGVVVELAKAGLSDTTDSLGRYNLGKATGLAYRLAGNAAGAGATLRGKVLWIRMGSPEATRATLSTLEGRTVAVLKGGPQTGEGLPFALPATLPPSRTYLLRIEGAGTNALYRILFAGGDALMIPVPAHANGKAGPASAKVATATDTLRARRSGYKTSETALDSFTGIQDIALETEAFGCAAGALCWDFEEGRIPDGWTTFRNEFNGTLLVDGTKPHKGGFALHAKDLVGGKEGVQGGPKKSIKYTLPANFGPILWGRAFVFTTPARPASHAGLFNARYPRPGSTNTTMAALDWYELATYQQTYMAIWHPPEPPGYPEWVLHSDKPLVLDAWACLEWVFDGSNGTAPEAADPRVWVDGTELAWPDTFVFSDPAGKPKPVMEKAQNFTMLETGVYLYQGLVQATNWWIDDLAVSSRRIGCQ